VVAVGVLDVGNVEGARVSLDVLEHSDSADVVTTDNQNLGTILVLNEALNFAGLEVQLIPNRGYLILKLFKEN
jgi:hypothetical protein